MKLELFRRKLGNGRIMFELFYKVIHEKMNCLDSYWHGINVNKRTGTSENIRNITIYKKSLFFSSMAVTSFFAFFLLFLSSLFHSNFLGLHMFPWFDWCRPFMWYWFIAVVI